MSVSSNLEAFVERFGKRIDDMIDTVARRHKVPKHIHMVSGGLRRLPNGLMTRRGIVIKPCYDWECTQEGGNMGPGCIYYSTPHFGPLDIVTRPTRKRPWTQ